MKKAVTYDGVDLMGYTTPWGCIDVRRSPPVSTASATASSTRMKHDDGRAICRVRVRKASTGTKSAIAVQRREA